MNEVTNYSILLFTAPSCPKCPAAKERVKAEGLVVTNIVVDTDANRAFALELKLRSVPAFIKKDRDSGEFEHTTIEELIADKEQQELLDIL